MKNVLIVGSILLVIIGMFAGAVALNDNSAALSGRTNREVALTCTSDMATQFHIHPHLEILINGEKQVVSADIGIKPGCMNALHTHDASGTLHIESPEKRGFTLADFFAVWGRVFNRNQVLQSVVDSVHRIRVTVNGVEVDTYENTVLRGTDQIVISYE